LYKRFFFAFFLPLFDWGRPSLALATLFWKSAADLEAVAAAFSFICAKARSCGVPARFMVVVVGAAPQAAPGNALGGRAATGGRGDGSLLVAAAMDAPGLW
jgi:hypothetical protein